jgi:hypothetical protein
MHDNHVGSYPKPGIIEVTCIHINKRMNMIQKSVLILFCTVFLFSIQAHFMSRIWPQKGLLSNNVGSSESKQKILIAGKASAFRDTVIRLLVEKLQNDSVFISIIDLKDIGSQEPEKWNAILLINMCVAWDYDNLVKNFLKKHPDYKNMVVFTTSGDPDGCFPKKKAEKNALIDGYSSASAKENVTPAVDTLYELLKKHLNK